MGVDVSTGRRGRLVGALGRVLTGPRADVPGGVGFPVTGLDDVGGGGRLLGYAAEPWTRAIEERHRDRQAREACSRSRDI